MSPPTRSAPSSTGGDASIGKTATVLRSQTVYTGQTAGTPRVERLGGYRPEHGAPFSGRIRMTTTTAKTTRVLLAAAAGAVALLAFGAQAAGAAPAASQQATDRCWLAVINDWLDNNQVDRIYAIPCYTQAIQHLNQFPDVKGYSSAADDIHRALLAAIRQDRGSGPGSGPPGPESGPNSPGGGTDGGSTPGPSRSLFDRTARAIGPGDAQSIPVPLLVLAGLAFLLLLAAAATWFARRVQSRRVTPAPARAPLTPKRR
jgi:hypothetical protein